MNDYSDESEETPSERGDSHPDEIPHEKSDAESFKPSEENPSDSSNEEIFNPHDDEEHEEEIFNPYDDEEQKEEIFNPYDDEEQEEEIFNPYDDEEQEEEIFNPYDDEEQEEEIFNPHDDEESNDKNFNPNEIPGEIPDENYNPSNTGTATISLNPETELENESEDEQEQDSDKGSDVKPDRESEKLEDDPELLFPEGDPMPTADSPKVVEMFGELEEIGIPTDPEPFYDPELEPETELEHVSERESDHEPEISPEHDPEENSEEQWEFVSPEGEPMPSVEKAIEELYDPEQEFERVLEQEPEKIGDSEITMDLVEVEKEIERNNSDVETSSESQSFNKKESDPPNGEIATEKKENKSTLLTQPGTQFQSNETNEESKSVDKIQERSSNSIERQELREKYRKETSKRPIYGENETKGFLEWIEKNKQNLEEKQETKEIGEHRGKKEELEDWSTELESWITEASDKDVSKENKIELREVTRKFRKFSDTCKKMDSLIKKNNRSKEEAKELETLFNKLEKMTYLQAALFRNLRAFQSLYNRYNHWQRNIILAQREKFIKHLAKKYKYLKGIDDQDEKFDLTKNWRESLKANLYRNTILSLTEKSIIIKIIQKDKINEESLNELISILVKLPTADLIALFGDMFGQHTQNYIKWGWDFYEYVKRDILISYINKHQMIRSQLRNGLDNENLNPLKFLEWYVQNNNITCICNKITGIAM